MSALLITQIRTLAVADIVRDEAFRSATWWTLRRAGYNAADLERVYYAHVRRLERRVAASIALQPAANDAALSDPALAQHVAQAQRLLQLAIEVPFVVGGAR